ncbi:UDP-glycosyltransferase 91A1-like [Humulus lupulus]|uniref:UDP-glycosyltransferase 91A1-like n=1 Tax=Humulus lupulus TaxID=3486 RepID=UPI002B41615F|nr:UDP-glycosyltransferase 91A1-like [Humulus lupulus]
MALTGTNQTPMTKDDDRNKLHIAMFPWLAFGHILPYLELAKLFAQKGHQISFISTPRNIQSLPKLAPNLSPLINLVKLPLPSSGFNLPIEAESTSDLPIEKVLILKKAHDALRDSLSDLLRSSKPDWLLFDFAAYWVPDMARSIGLQNAYFSIFNAACLGYLGTEFPNYRTEPEDFIVPPKWVPFPSTVAYRKFEVSKFLKVLTGNDDDISFLYRIIQTLRGCDVVAVRSCWELETEWLSLMADLLGKPVLPIGQLAPAVTYDDENDDIWKSTKQWLDFQPKRSVVYVAFGSEALPNQDELTEIAHGLEISGFPFFWVLKTRPDSAELPTGFEERTRERGIVCTSWAPQLKILAHDSIGGFLSHSGWSSVVEALQFGIPLLLLAFINDQGLNAKLLDENMIGYMVPRDENDGSFTRESVAESVKLVVEKEEGKVYREKAKEMSPVFGDREVQSKYVDEFLAFLKEYRTKSSKEEENTS